MNTCSDPQLMLDLQMDYVVERIEKRRVRNGQLEYLVKWQDLPNSNSTWRKAELLDCQELIEDFETLRKSRHKNKRKSRHGNKRSKGIAGETFRNHRNSGRYRELRSSTHIGQPPAGPGSQYSQRDFFEFYQ